jgi:hypothetical protein
MFSIFFSSSFGFCFAWFAVCKLWFLFLFFLVLALACVPTPTCALLLSLLHFYSCLRMATPFCVSLLLLPLACRCSYSHLHVVTPYPPLLFPTHRYFSPIAIPRPSLLLQCCSSPIAIPYSLLFFTHHCSPIVVPHPLLLLAHRCFLVVFCSLLLLAHGCSLPMTTSPLFFPTHCYSLLF